MYFRVSSVPILSLASNRTGARHKDCGTRYGEHVLRKVAFAILLCLGFVATSHAQTCVAVTPTGSGTKSGADWNNAMADLPSPLVRGTTYYLSDGSYGSYVDIEVPVSGTSTITIKKAVASGDYGQNCSPSIAAGWNGSTMGSGRASFINNSTGSSCAVFWIANTANTGYITVDGQVGSGETEGSYGIYLQQQYNSAYCRTQPSSIWVGSHGAHSASNVNFSYVEISGSCGGVSPNTSWFTNCQAILNTPKGDHNVELYNCTTCSFNHMFIHDSSAVPFDMVQGDTGVTFSKDYILRNCYSGTQHSEIWDLHGGNNSNITISYNVIHDTTGTGGIVSLNSGTGGTDSTVVAYGNVWYQDQNPNPYGIGAAYGNGVVACINTNQNCPGWKFFQNTIIYMTSNSDGVYYDTGHGVTGDVAVENNIWFDSQTSSTGFQLTGTSVEDYNSFLNYANSPGGSGSHDVKNASVPTPFTGWTTGNFTLASGNSNWDNRASLPNGNWNTDAAGNTFTTSRGAYQYAGTVTQPAPPSSLTVTGVS
jgi:hypothetical protein